MAVISIQMARDWVSCVNGLMAFASQSIDSLGCRSELDCHRVIGCIGDSSVSCPSLLR
jgi:hypothetical protein